MMYSCLLMLLFVGSVFSRSDSNLPPNPCPNVFNYYYDIDGSIFGEIIVPNDGSTVFRMEVNVSYVGIFDEQSRPKVKLDLTTAKEYLLDARQLTYKMTFDKQDKIPRVTQIRFNDRVYCRGPSGPLTSEGISDLWVFKETRLQTFTYYPDDPKPMRPIPRMKPTMPPFIPPRTTTAYPWISAYDKTESYGRPERIVENPGNDQDCGVPLSSKTINLITDGSNTTQNEFPWLVALYHWKGLNYEFRCTANLVDNMHVITVASCLKFYKSDLVKQNDILLVFGKSNLRQWAAKSDAVVRTVAAVDVNPEYTQYSGHGDMALLTLQQPVQYSASIRPICLWKGSPDVQEVINRYGTVAGWGKDENQVEFSTNAKKVQMPVVSEQMCMMSNPEFAKLVSYKTFCAGERNGRGPCTGDIGSPFMLQMNGKWYLRGMVSQAIVNRGTSQCNLNEYIVFSDVAKYSRWVSTKLNNNT
ncbi:serine protease gd-like isoform X2 [Coccinella septempunctata]|nr:serine protease gd-like isoform X2 [Coccinella septempunctata]